MLDQSSLVFESTLVLPALNPSIMPVLGFLRNVVPDMVLKVPASVVP